MDQNFCISVNNNKYCKAIITTLCRNPSNLECTTISTAICRNNLDSNKCLDISTES